MRSKKILLVNSNPVETGIIEKAIEQLSSGHMTNNAVTGKDGLNAIMGSLQYHSEKNPRVRKSKPDIIILDAELPDMSCRDFIEIIRKYYTLKHIRIFISTMPGEELNYDFYKKLKINGYLYKPLNSRNLEPLKAELDSDSTHMALLPFWQINSKLRSGFSFFKHIFLREKLLLLNTSSAGIKLAAACAVSSAVIGSTAFYNNSKTDLHSYQPLQMAAPDKAEKFTPADVPVADKKHHSRKRSKKAKPETELQNMQQPAEIAVADTSGAAINHKQELASAPRQQLQPVIRVIAENDSLPR